MKYGPLLYRCSCRPIIGSSVVSCMYTSSIMCYVRLSRIYNRDTLLSAHHAASVVYHPHYSWRALQFIHIMHPSHLRRPCRIFTSLQYPHNHLVVDIQRVVCDEPPQTLRARRCRKTTLVGPKLLKAPDILNHQRRVKLHDHTLLRVHFWQCRGQLGEETRRCSVTSSWKD